MNIDSKLYNCGIVRQDLFGGLSRSLGYLIDEIGELKEKVDYAKEADINARFVMSASSTENIEDRLQNIRRELDKIYDLNLQIEMLKKFKEGEYNG